MKKILIILISILSLLFLRSTIVYILTENLINNYEEKNYDDSSINTLYLLNFNLSYIDFYNHGNIYYQEKNYNRAIDRYNIALKKNPPEDKVCDIQINLALSILGLMENDNKKSHLQEAREVLYKNDCAHENDDKGKSKQAEELEEEIKEQEKQNSEEKPGNSNDDPNNNDSNNTNSTDSNIEEQIKNEVKNSTKSRDDELERNENSKDYDFDYKGDRW